MNEIKILGNKTTRDNIISREIPFSKGDTVSKSDIPKLLISIKQNLLNTSLFNFVRVDTVSASSNKMDFFINVSERWYIWPMPIFEVQERNFNVWWQDGRSLHRASYGLYLNKENFRGRKEELSLYAQFGYTERFGFSYTIPYLTKKQTSGLGISFAYSRNREIYYGTFDNQVTYFYDPIGYLRQEMIGKIYYTYRKGIHNTHHIEARYINSLINDTLNAITTDYFINTQTHIEYFLLDYAYRSDHRDSKAYPLRGFMYEAEAKQLGLGLFKDEKINVTNFYFTIKKYQKLSERFYAAGSFKIKFSPETYQPYYVQQGLGWNNDYVRGYEYYAVDGQRWGLAKLGMKYELVKPHVKTIPGISLEKFNTFHYALYAGIFADAGYVDDHMYSLVNPLANTFLYGAGVGIDYVTYYDVVIRFEYSINRKLENGFFVHFNAGI